MHAEAYCSMTMMLELREVWTLWWGCRLEISSACKIHAGHGWSKCFGLIVWIRGMIVLRLFQSTSPINNG